MTARTDAQALHERRPGEVLELDLDYCNNTYGVAPCTAGRVESGTAQAGAASALTLRAAASAVDDAYKGMTARITGGAGGVQERKVSGYVGATKVATVSPAWRRNALTKSSAVDHANWTKHNGITITANYGAAPDGSMKAERVQTDGVSLARYFQTVTGFSGKTVCFALKMRSLTGGNQSIRMFLLEAITFDPNYGSFIATVTPEWQTFSMSAAIPGGSSAVMALIYDNTASVVYDIAVCEHQWNEGTTPDDFVETDTVAVGAPDATSTYDIINRAVGCYNVFAGASPCQDTPNYVKGVKTLKFCGRGMPLPAGEQLRPYIAKLSVSPTEINTAKGLAARSQTSVDLMDEPCRDDLDKYVDDRAAAAGGSFWPRLIARNPNASGRFARLRKGYVTTPWDWSTFQTELYVIEGVSGPDRNGRVSVKLSDAVKLLDRVKLPVPTDGKLAADLPATFNTGSVVAAASTTVQLASSASTVDDFYNGHEILITGGVGLDQRRVVTDYVGLTRTATVAAWGTIPDTTSFYEVAPLFLNVGSGKGAQYNDPATTGKQEFVRIGDEVIRFTVKSTDTLSWPDGTYRAQFGTTRAAHKANDGVQQCLAYIGETPAYVVENLCNLGGLADAYLDLAGLAAEQANWYATGALITACIAEPETGSELLADLCQDLNLMVWWHPVEQKVKFKANMPELGTVQRTLTDDDFLEGSASAQSLDAERLTRAAISFDLFSATEDRKKWASYRTRSLFIDAPAESANGYNDVRADVRYSRWLSAANLNFAENMVRRRLKAVRDAPVKVKASLDPRTEVTLGALVDVLTRRQTGADGEPLTTRCRVMRVLDNGAQFDVDLRTTKFGARYAFICPNGYPNYPSATDDQRRRAFIAQNTGVMSDGSPAYLII